MHRNAQYGFSAMGGWGGFMNQGCFACAVTSARGGVAGGRHVAPFTPYPPLRRSRRTRRRRRRLGERPRGLRRPNPRSAFPQSAYPHALHLPTGGRQTLLRQRFVQPQSGQRALRDAQQESPRQRQQHRFAFGVVHCLSPRSVDSALSSGSRDSAANMSQRRLARVAWAGCHPLPAE